MFGSKSDIPEEQLHFYLNAGYSIVSVDYRLAPETKLPEIVMDIGDAVQWVYEYGRDSLKIDPEKIFIVGHSGGAYLALVSGYFSKVRLCAIVSFYGYGDIRSEWYNTPDSASLTRPKISEESAKQLIRDSILTSASVDERLDLYFYTRQHGIWPQLVTGHNPKEEPEWFKPYCPIENIDSHFPPTLLIHGDKDTDVPFTESTQLKYKLESRGIDHSLIQMKNVGHLFDVFNGGLSNHDIAAVFDKVTLFLNQYR
jgi:acetyl esterase/lipase